MLWLLGSQEKNRSALCAEARAKNKIGEKIPLVGPVAEKVSNLKHCSRRATDVLRWNNPSLYSKSDAQGVDIWVGSQDSERLDPQSVTDACVISSSKIER